MLSAESAHRVVKFNIGTPQLLTIEKISVRNNQLPPCPTRAKFDGRKLKLKILTYMYLFDLLLFYSVKCLNALIM